LLLGGLAVLCGVLGLPRRSWRNGVLTAASLASLALMSGTTALYLCRDEAARGIVLSATAGVRLSPFDHAEVLGNPGAGRGVRLGTARGAFHYVEVPGTPLCGWMADTEVAAIIPR